LFVRTLEPQNNYSPIKIDRLPIFDNMDSTEPAKNKTT